MRFLRCFWSVFSGEFSACFSDLFVAISTGNFEWISTGFSSKFRWQNADQGHFDTVKVTLNGVLLFFGSSVWRVFFGFRYENECFFSTYFQPAIFCLVILWIG